MVTDEERIDAAVLAQNFSRFMLAPFVAVPVSVGHIVAFALSLPEPGSIEHRWRVGIISVHAALVLLALVLGAVAYLHRRHAWVGGYKAWLVIDSAVLLFLMSGVVLVLFDQLVTPAITPFLVVCTLVGVAILLPPTHAFVLFATAYAAFYALISTTQPDPTILLSNRVNGLTIVGIAFMLSTILWRRTSAGIRQGIVIDTQQAELAQRNQELLRQSEELRDLNATKDKFFSIIAHDLKNPFNSIIGFSELLRNDARDSSVETIENYANHIYDSAVQTHELLDNLLYWARMQQGVLAFAPRPVRLHSVVEDALRLVASGARQKRIALMNSVPEGISVVADADMLQTILRNLLSNAIKFTGDGGKVEIAATQLAEQIEISVSDDGIGISTENVDRLFRRDENFTMSGTANEIGTGIGLVLCKEFVDHHRGRLTVKSEPGRGATFTISLPSNGEAAPRRATDTD